MAEVIHAVQRPGSLSCLNPSVGSEKDGIGKQNEENDDQAAPGRELSSNTQEAGGADQHGHDAAEDDNLSVQPDMACNDRTQPQQRGQVEDVRAQYHSGTNDRLVVHQGRDGGRDLRCIGG
jgi:hypothetical protein